MVDVENAWSSQTDRIWICKKILFFYAFYPFLKKIGIDSSFITLGPGFGFNFLFVLLCVKGFCGMQ